MRLIGPKKVVILGGGLSGITATYYVTKKYSKCEVTVVERQNRFGGWVNTQKSDFLFEMVMFEKLFLRICATMITHAIRDQEVFELIQLP